jgi:hypothetical protein
VIKQLNLNMFRADYNPRDREDRMERLRKKYLKNREDQVTDSIK